MRHALISSLVGASVLASLAIAEPSAAAIVYSNNFTSSACSFTCSLTGGTVLAAPNGTQSFLGNLGQGASATLTISGLNTNKTHTGITVGFSLYVIGSMDGNGQQGGNFNSGGDLFTIGYTGSGSGTIFNYNFANYGGGNTQSYGTSAMPGPNANPTTGAATVNALGYTGFPDSGNGIQDSEYNFNSNGVGPLAFSDSGNTLTITFTSLSNEGLSNEFYGIDNIVVQTTGGTNPPINANVPEPMPVLLMGIGLVAFIAEKRRRR